MFVPNAVLRMFVVNRDLISLSVTSRCDLERVEQRNNSDPNRVFRDVLTRAGSLRFVMNAIISIAHQLT